MLVVTYILNKETILGIMIFRQLATTDVMQYKIREITKPGNSNITVSLLLVELEDGNCVDYFLI